MLRRTTLFLSIVALIVLGLASPGTADSTSGIYIRQIYRVYSEFDSDNPTYDEVCSKDGPFPSNYSIKGCGSNRNDTT